MRPAEDPAQSKLLMCAACRRSVCCSRTCQKRHWKEGHKAECEPHIEFPVAGDPSRDVRD